MKKETNYLRIYEITAALILLVSVVTILSDPACFYKMLDSDLNILISDFKSHIEYTEDLKNTYNTTIHACFPPLIYLFYHFLYLIIPTDFQLDAMYSFVYMIYLAVAFVLFAFVCSKMLEKESTINRLIATVFIVLSTPFVFGIIEQGNIVILPMMLLSIAVTWRNSKNKVKRELALVFIAIAAGIKVYPAVFGLIYIVEKRYKEALRLIIYGILFFFIPFAFTGGFDGFLTFLSNQSEVHQIWGQCSAISIYSFSLFYFGLSKNSAIILSGIFGILAVLMTFFAKRTWQKYFMLIFIMVMCPLWSGQYTVCFFLIPFFEFLRANEQSKKDKLYNAIYITMFSLIFSANIISRTVGGLKTSVPAIIIFLIIIIQNLFESKRTVAKE